MLSKCWQSHQKLTFDVLGIKEADAMQAAVVASWLQVVLGVEGCWGNPLKGMCESLNMTLQGLGSQKATAKGCFLGASHCQFLGKFGTSTVKGEMPSTEAASRVELWRFKCRMSELLSIGWEFRSWSDGKRIPAGVIKRGWENPVAWRFWDLVRWEPSNWGMLQRARFDYWVLVQQSVMEPWVVTVNWMGKLWKIHWNLLLLLVKSDGFL